MNRRLTTYGAGLFLINAIVYNLLFNGSEWMSDLWYVMNYIAIALLLWPSVDRNKVAYVAFVACCIRILYNVGLLLKIYTYDFRYANYGVLSLFILTLIFFEVRWRN